MAHVITDLCRDSKDQSCVQVCPVDCIHPYPEVDGEQAFEESLQLYIDPDVCIDCGACAPACPVSAIFFDDDLPEEKRGFIDLNRDYFAGTNG